MWWDLWRETYLFLSQSCWASHAHSFKAWWWEGTTKKSINKNQRILRPCNSELDNTGLYLSSNQWWHDLFVHPLWPLCIHMVTCLEKRKNHQKCTSKVQKPKTILQCWVDSGKSRILIPRTVAKTWTFMNIPHAVRKEYIYIYIYTQLFERISKTMLPTYSLKYCLRILKQIAVQVSSRTSFGYCTFKQHKWLPSNISSSRVRGLSSKDWQLDNACTKCK